MPNPETTTFDVAIGNKPLAEYVSWDVAIVSEPHRRTVSWDVVIDRTWFTHTSWDVRTVHVAETSWDAAISEEDGTFRGVLNDETERDTVPMLVPGDTVVIMDPSSGTRAREQHYTGTGWLESTESGGPEGKQKRRKVFPSKTGWWIELGESETPFKYTNGIITPISVDEDGVLTLQLATVGTAVRVLDPAGFERITISSATGLRSNADATRPGLVGVFGDRDLYMESRPSAGGPGVLGAELLLAGGSTADDVEFETAPLQAQPGQRLLVAFEEGTNTNPVVAPSIASDILVGGPTFVQVGTALYRSGSRRMTLWRATMPSTLLGPFRITFTSADVMTRGLWTIVQVSQADATTLIADVTTTEDDPGGQNNNGTSWGFTQSYAAAGDRVLIFLGHEENEAAQWSADPDHLYDELGSVGTSNPRGALSVGWLSGFQDTSPSVSWPSETPFAGIGVVLKVAATLTTAPATVGFESDVPEADFVVRSEDTVSLYARRWPSESFESAWYQHEDEAGTGKRRLVGPNLLSSNPTVQFVSSTTGESVFGWTVDPGFIVSGQLWRVTLWGRASCPSDATPTNHTIKLDLDMSNPGVEVLTLPLVTPTSSALTDEPWECEFQIGWASTSPNAASTYRAMGRLSTNYGTATSQVVRRIESAGIDTTVAVDGAVRMAKGEVTAGYALVNEYAALLVD